MTETNELQPIPEVEAAEVEATQAPVAEAEPPTETPAVEENISVPEGSPVTVPEGSPEGSPEDSQPVHPLYETKEQVVDRLREIQAEDNGGDRSELDLLKQAFYNLHKAAQIAARNAFLEAGGQPEDWHAEVDGAEENFKAIMASIRQRRAQLAEEAEKLKEFLSSEEGWFDGKVKFDREAANAR